MTQHRDPARLVGKDAAGLGVRRMKTGHFTVFEELG